MAYLVDANVLSEATKRAPSQAVVQWLRRHDTEIVVSPIVVGELEFGILLLPAGMRRTRLLKWFSSLRARLRIAEIDGQTARVWAVLLADLRRRGNAMPVKDSLIAASALQHNLTVATRNTKDFRAARVRLTDPFAVR